MTPILLALMSSIPYPPCTPAFVNQVWRDPSTGSAFYCDGSHWQTLVTDGGVCVDATASTTGCVNTTTQSFSGPKSFIYTNQSSSDQLDIVNYADAGANTLTLEGFSAWDGTGVNVSGWVGLTAATFQYGYPNYTFLENISPDGGVALLADDPNGRIDFLTGCYNSLTNCGRMRIMPSGNVGIGTQSPASKFEVGSTAGGAASGITLTLQNTSGTASLRYAPFDLKNTSGLAGQLIITDPTYSNASLNVPGNSVGLAAEATSSSLSLIGGDTASDIRFTVGGLAPVNEVMRLVPSGLYTDAGITVKNQLVPTQHGATQLAIEIGADAGTNGALTVAFATAFGAAPICNCTHVNTTNTSPCNINSASLPSTSTASFMVDAGGTDKIMWSCMGSK